MTATFRSPFPHTVELTGFQRRRLDYERPRFDGHYKSENDFYRVAASHQGLCGGYWTGEVVDHHDLVRLEPSQLQQADLGLCLGDQIGVLHEGRWVAGFVGVIGDPFDAWSTMLSSPTEVVEVEGKVRSIIRGAPFSSKLDSLMPSPNTSEGTFDLFGRGGPNVGGPPNRKWKVVSYPPPDAPFIDITVSVADGQGTTGSLFDERRLITDPRKWRDNFCCSFEVVRLYQPEWHTYLREIDGATVVINRETKQVLHRLSASPSQQEEFLRRMPQQRRPEGSFGRVYGRTGPHRRDGFYGDRSQRESSRDRWTTSRVSSDDSSNLSYRQEAPRSTFSGGTFQGRPVGLNYKSASKSQRPFVELESAVKSKSDVERKPAVKSKPAVVSTPIVDPKPPVELFKSKSGLASKSADESKPIVDPKPPVELIKLGSASTPVVAPTFVPGLGFVLASPQGLGFDLELASRLASELSPVDPAPIVAHQHDCQDQLSVKPASHLDLTPAIEPTPAIVPVIEPAPAIAPTSVVALQSRTASGPDPANGQGFAKGWTSRTSRVLPSKGADPPVMLKPSVASPSVASAPPSNADNSMGAACVKNKPRNESTPPADNSHASLVAECVRKYVVPPPTKRQQTRRLRKRAYASRKDGDSFHAARQQSPQVCKMARRQYDGRSLDRRDVRCRGKLGLHHVAHPPSATFVPFNDEVFFDADDGHAHRWGTLSTDPRLVDSFSSSSLTLLKNPAPASALKESGSQREQLYQASEGATKLQSSLI
ncbi:hypothetical protein THAOC_07489 [Thalassiosira oceanica]|uniref:Uncharacterized protein n=1 Tax=Thalassiosira oceanica TaxID=159749 RepID=K0SXE9_THAOC|nr:hypothetical protein THAOC_07489 [Thalassiosira oceanica]|eukprot:EJK71103.1 hypothetical protein THAOC_07489 [Thalassiosira oceanica]